MQYKTSLKVSDVVPCNSKENANTFCRFFFLWILPCPKNKFAIKISEKQYSEQMCRLCSVQYRCNNSR